MKEMIFILFICTDSFCDIIPKITFASHISISKDLFEMKLKKLFSIFCYIKLLSWTLLFISFIPQHVIVRVPASHFQ